MSDHSSQPLPSVPRQDIKIQPPPPPLVQDLKECRVCMGCKPANNDYFDTDRSRQDNLHLTCKACRAAAREKRDQQACLKFARKVDDATLATLEAIGDPGNGAIPSESLPHVATVFEDILTLMGGSKGFATHFLANYLATEPGKQSRTKILTAVVQLAEKVSATGAAEMPIKYLSDDELRKRFMEKGQLVEQALEDARSVGRDIINTEAQVE